MLLPICTTFAIVYSNSCDIVAINCLNLIVKNLAITRWPTFLMRN